MSRHRSPIEMMVDKACDVDQPKHKSCAMSDDLPAKLLAVADAAVLWRKGFIEMPHASIEVQKLMEAVDAWLKALRAGGWLE